MAKTVDKRRLLGDATALAVFFAAIVVANLVSDLLSLPGIPEFAIRPQVGIFAAGLLLLGKRLRPFALPLGALALLVAARGSDLLPLPVIALCGALEALAFTVILDRFCPDLRMENAAHVFAVVAAGSAVSTAAAALAMALPARLGTAPFYPTFRLWSMSDAIGIMLAVPFSSSLKRFLERPKPIDGRAAAEIALLFAAAAGLGGTWFLDLPANPVLLFFLLTAPLPFLLLAGTRYGTFGSASASIIVFACAIWGTALGKGVMLPFSADYVQRMVLVHAYAMSFSLLPLFNASAIERKRDAEESLASSERRHKIIVDSINDIIVILDGQGKIAYANPAFDRLMGIEAERVMGRSVKALIVAEDGPRVNEALDRVLRLGSRIEHLIFRLMRHDGSFLVVEAMALNMLEDGAVNGVVVTMHDLTERVQAAERLMAANAELEDANADAESARAQAERALAVKSAFLSNMSHEIRTPLTGMMGMTSLLSKTELDAAQRSYVDGLRQSSRVLLGIVNDILDSEKLDYDAVKPDPEPTDAKELCLSILEGFGALAGEKGIELASSFEGLDGALMIDRRLVSRILANLVGNAVKFTESGSVRLEARYDEGGRGGPVLAVTVRDTGIGMAPEEIGTLFSRFTQLDSSYSKKYDGTGLGLHIAKRAAELLDGNIKVESEPGKGSAFTVELPCPRERVKA